MLLKVLKNIFCSRNQQFIQTPKEAVQNAQIPPIQQRRFVHRSRTYIQNEALVTLVWNVSITLTVQFTPGFPPRSRLLPS